MLRGSWAPFSVRCELEKVGFECHSDAAKGLSEGGIRDEGGFSDSMAQLVCVGASARLRRLLWVTTGWPWSMSRFLGPSHRAPCLQEVARGLQVWRDLQACDNKGDVVNN